MKFQGKHIYNVLRTIVVTTIVGVVVLYSALYVLLCIPAVQRKIKQEGERQLSALLKTNVTIGEINIKPFTQLALYDVKIPDQQHHDLFEIATLGAGIDIEKYLLDDKIVVTYAEIVGLQGHITRANKNSPTNMQFIIDAFKPKDDKPPTQFDLQVRKVIIRNSGVTYDVLSEPRITGRLDNNHLAVVNVRADIVLPRLKNDDIVIDIKRLSASEQSGLQLKHLSGELAIGATRASVSDLCIELPGTVLTPNNQVVEYASLKQLATAVKSMPIDLRLENNRVTPADFKALVPALLAFTSPYVLSCSVEGGQEQLNIEKLNLLSGSKQLRLQAKGVIRNVGDKSSMKIDVPEFDLSASSSEIAKILSAVKLNNNVQRIISASGDINAKGAFAVAASRANFKGNITCGLGRVNLDASMQKALNQQYAFEGEVESADFNIGKLLDKQNTFGSISLKSFVKVLLQNKRVQDFTLLGDVNYVDYNGYRFQNISADVTGSHDTFTGEVTVDDPNGALALIADVALAGEQSKFDIDLQARDLNLAKMQLVQGEEHIFSCNLHTIVEGNSLDNVNGAVDLTNIHYISPAGKSFSLNGIHLQAVNDSYPQHISLQSDFLNGSISGEYDMKTLIPAVKSLLWQVMPDYFSDYAHYDLSTSKNDFTFNFVVEPNEQFQNLVKLPLKLLYKTTIKGNVNIPEKDLNVLVDIPYILQGKNVVEETQIAVKYDKDAEAFLLNAGMQLPSKDKMIFTSLSAKGCEGSIYTNLAWKYDRERDFHGNLILDTHLTKDENNSLEANVEIHPSAIVVNDTAWNVEQGSIQYAHERVKVNVNANRPGQFIQVTGTASPNPEDQIVLKLKDINLDYIFDVLQISNVDFGGDATGTFYARDVFSKTPHLSTPNLHIKRMSYNGALMGDGDIKSFWDNDNQAVAMDLTLNQDNGLKSYIKGGIYPMQDSLYLVFDVQRANVKFLKPFMQAFTNELGGVASGHAVLYGNFHDINAYGDLYAEDLALKLGFSNVTYYCTDSIHMEPGLLKFNNITLRDRDNNTAKLNGWLKHDFFHRPSFNFTITNAKDFLCYDTNAMLNPVWYGTIYGNGAVFIKGEPGIVNIKVNMETAPRSRFTFVLSDDEVASDYHFITYRDRDVLNAPPVVEPDTDDVPEEVKAIKMKVEKEEVSIPTNYKIDLEGLINPSMQMVLVMDPAGGDVVNCTGNGNLQMKWDNNEQRLDMYGKYVLDKGSYHFTLQDIILKDFSIKEGSSVSFQGNPYKAILDLEAIYSLNANILDLDESFASDRELNRTNVPVHALLKAKGEISQPEIGFDLDFPTLPSEAYRKVKSIISTDDMMNRQMIYLLALNRFYTPDYMNASSSNNELSSIASSTISSQLSSILGRLNDKWSISPNFRSNKGDFSDTEFDLALSSTLLNNRLRLNGNFGYRDNTYNTKNSNFIGDFDIEYLLNSRGTWILKGYNHFNDRNYYVRNAMTTQGVGLVFKHDFDRWFDFLKKKKK